MILIMDTLLELKGDLDPVNFGQKLSHWLSFGKSNLVTRDMPSHCIGFPELSDEGGSGCGRTTYNVLSAPDFKTDPHKVRVAQCQLQTYSHLLGRERCVGKGEQKCRR